MAKEKMTEDKKEAMKKCLKDNEYTDEDIRYFAYWINRDNGLTPDRNYPRPRR